MHRFVRHLSSYGRVVSPMDFKPKTALIVTKVSRYEFERHKHKELSEVDFEHLLTNRGSDYTMIRLAFCFSSISSTLSSIVDSSLSIFFRYFTHFPCSAARGPMASRTMFYGQGNPRRASSCRMEIGIADPNESGLNSLIA